MARTGSLEKAAQAQDVTVPAEPDSSQLDTAKKVFAVHRLGAITIGVVIATFGILGFLDGLAYFSTEGERVLGLSTNGLLSTISIVTAAVLFYGAFAGARIASDVMSVVGVLFLISGLANLAVLRTEFNLLAFSMSNVIFSVCAGLVLLTLGFYGRVSGNLPRDNPYYAEKHPEALEEDEGEEPEWYPTTPEEHDAEAQMREAEIAVVQKRASTLQAAGVAKMARETSRYGRYRAWQEHVQRNRQLV